MSYQHDTVRYLGPEPPIITRELSSLITQFQNLPHKFRKRLATSIMRLNLASRRGSEVDSALDTAIALETVLASDTRGEITYRLRLRSALLLDADLSSRQKTSNAVRALYDLRSAVVHNGTEGATGDVEVARNGREIAMRVLRRLLMLAQLPDWQTLELSGGNHTHPEATR